MGSLGSVAFQADEEQPFLGYQLAQRSDYSDATASRIDRELEHIVAERQSAVRQLLTGARERLDTLAATLLADDTVREDVLERLLGPRPVDTARDKETGSHPVGMPHEEG